MADLLRPIYYYGGRLHGYAALCPACTWEHRFELTPSTWTFNGNFASPTFSPSMFFNREGYYDPLPRCHSFLENGIWRFLPDSTHEMAGLEVPMIPIEPNRSIFDYVKALWAEENESEDS